MGNFLSTPKAIMTSSGMARTLLAILLRIFPAVQLVIAKFAALLRSAFPSRTDRSRTSRHVRKVPIAELTLLDRTPMIFRLHALHAWKLSDDAVLIEHLQAKLDIREHNISRTPDDEI